MMNLGHDSEATLNIALSTKSTKACEETNQEKRDCEKITLFSA